jgi:ELWxxDGT repeat protein
VGRVYVIDGTTTQQVVSGSLGAISSNPMALGSFVLYGDDDAAGYELWRTNGTAAGTFRVRDVNPGPNDGFRGGLVALDSTTALFVGDASLGRRLWRTNGTSPGTVLVTTGLIPPIDPEIFAATGTGLAFFAANWLLGQEMFVTDGTNAGTFVLLDDATGTWGRATASGSTPTATIAARACMRRTARVLARAS